MQSNIGISIKEKIGRNLHNLKNHPLEIIKKEIISVLGNEFQVFSELSPNVSIKNNFDDLLIPKEHPSRSPTDTYYVDDYSVLRTHTSAHQHELLVSGCENFLAIGDVYRRDEIDRFHYPVFHQMEGVKICDNPKEDLLKTLTGLVNHLFPGCEYRIVDSYFPFTEPSYEIEVLWKDKWVEVLGCGVIHSGVLSKCTKENQNLIGKTGWAFGLGLERLAMILFEIPDIRLFWSEDPRFMKQFELGKIVKFQEYSKYPACTKDIAFWLEDENYNYNDFCDIARDCGKDLIEDISLVDEFKNLKNNKTSHCYRISYRSNERSLTNEEINELYFSLREEVSKKLNVSLR